MSISFKYYLLVIILLFVTACGTQNITKSIPESTNTKVVAAIQADEYSTEPGKIVTLSAQNSLIQGTENVSYLWISKTGEVLGREPILHWEAPSIEGIYEITLVLNFQEENESTSTVTVSVKKTTPILDLNDSTFSTINKMIKLSKEGTLKDVTYICVGDSTRASTITPDHLENHSDMIFTQVKQQLQNYQVNTFLDSQGGLTFKAYLGRGTYLEDGRNWINIQETIDKIPNDGYSTIVDISLAVNDLSGLDQLYPDTQYPQYYEESDYQFFRDKIKSLLLETLHRIRHAKPQVKFMLTTPNPMRDWKNGATIYQRVYKEVAQEEHIPLANFVDEIMPPHGTSEFKSWYLDNIHFNTTVGLPRVSDFLLSKMLPQD